MNTLESPHSYAESHIFLEFKMLGMKVERQKPIGKYFADFFLPEWNLVLEIDGREYHYSREAQQKDRERDSFMNQQGYGVVRVTGSMARLNPSGVLGTLKYLKGAKTYFINSESDLKNIYLAELNNQQ